MIAISPMLLSEIPGHRSRIMSAEYVFVQPKLDGWCCMANTRTRKIYTRSGAEITTLPHINKALPYEGPEWLHGELWRPGADCDVMQSMVKRGDTSVEFHVFDCVSDEGFGDRIGRGLCYYPMPDLTINGPIKHVRTSYIMTDDITDFYENYLEDGYEGIVIRLDGHGYEHGRSINIFKMKPGTEVI